MKSSLFSIVLASTLGTIAFGSGWNCHGVGGELKTLEVRVKLFNQTLAPRVPAVFIVSEKNLGTVLVARDEAIEKSITGLNTTYFATSTDADLLEKSLGWQTVELIIPHREGVDKPLKDGSPLTASIQLTTESEVDTIPLTCRRYLKKVD